MNKLLSTLLILAPMSGFAAELTLAPAPLSVTANAEPNVMLLIDDSGSMRNNVSDTQTRLDAAKQAAKTIVNDVSGVRFGLASFNNNHGGAIDKVCGTDATTLKNSIDALKHENWTPLSESLYEVTRYFRGMKSYYNGDKYYTSPIQYRCQKNFTIVLTDGLPTYDKSFPSSDPDYTASQKLPDWDGVHPDTTYASRPNFPDYSDGFYDDGDGYSQSVEGSYLYIDDVAKFAWDIDMRKSGTDLDGKSFEDPDFDQQNMYTYTVGFTLDNNILENAAEYGHGEYYTANDVDQLTRTLKQALSDIIAKSGTASAAAASTGSIQAGSKVFFARFNSADWSGGLLAYELETDRSSNSFGQLKKNPSRDDGALWDAADELPAWGSRNIFTNKTDGIRFRWGQFTTAEKAEYLNSEQAMLQYLRGRNDSDSNIDVSKYRSRTNNMGDVVHSSPVYVAKPFMGFSDAIESSKPYSSFVSTYKNRTPMIYVGANDGMLHGFNAETGKEEMAYIPGSLLPKLKKLADPDYSHQYYVDGTPSIVDAFVGGEWKTVLIGGLNSGGQSIYALDITDPSKFDETNTNAQSLFMWEFTHPNLGYSHSTPRVIKLKDGKWYVAFGSGYNNTEADGAASTDGDGYIFIVDIATGTLKYTLSTKEGKAEDPTGKNRPNGIPDIMPVDFNQDAITDAIYTGDLFGNVWKFDLSGSLSTIGRYKLFEACSKSSCGNSSQPITSSILVGSAPSGRGDVMVYVGTGKYIETTDNNGPDGGIQTVYGFYDDGSHTTLTRSNLQEQKIVYEDVQSFTDDKGTSTTSDDETYDHALRVTTTNSIGSSQKGWYIDLVSPRVGQEGERIVSTMTLRRGRLIFLSSIPSKDTCTPAGDLWFFDFNAYTGSPLHYSPFDNDNNRKFNTDDYVQPKAGTPVSQPTAAVARKVKGGGTAAAPAFVHDRDGDLVYLPDKTVYTINTGPGLGRVKWRQLYR